MQKHFKTQPVLYDHIQWNPLKLFHLYACAYLTFDRVAVLFWSAID